MIEVYDHRGCKFEIIGGCNNVLYLKDVNGAIHDVTAEELCKEYTGQSPEVTDAFKQLTDMLKSGKITMEEIRKLKEAL